jgi:hypothetical protein
MTELSQRARDLIETVGDHDGPGPSDRERVRRTLFTALAGAGATVAGSASATATAKAGAALGSGALAAGAGKVSATVALWIVGGGIAGFAIAAPVAMYAVSPLSISASAQPATANLAKPVAPQAIAATEPAPPSAAAEPALTPEVDAVPVPARRDRQQLDPAPEPAKAASPSVSAEVDLLKSAQRALSAGDAAAALSLLDRHGREFPGGALTVERMAAQVFALCELGRVVEARRVAGAFLKAAPNSPLVPRVTASCAGSGPK